MLFKYNYNYIKITYYFYNITADYIIFGGNLINKIDLKIF